MLNLQNYILFAKKLKNCKNNQMHIEYISWDLLKKIQILNPIS